jgi:hypothetical protein
MTATTTTPLQSFRDLLAFGLSTCEELELSPYNVQAYSGDELSIYLDADDDTEAVERLALALGVTPELRVQKINGGKCYVVYSRGARPFYIPDGQPYDYKGRSVPFAGRLVSVEVICSLRAD